MKMMTQLFRGNVRVANLKENGDVKLENQVCSLELSRRLKELGVKQESLFYWVNCKSGAKIYFEGQIDYITAFIIEESELFSAYTVAELAEILPVMVQSYKSFKEHWECVYDPLEIGFVEKTEADTRAKMLIHFLKNKLMELPDEK